MCQRSTSNVTCFNQQGVPIPSYTCQTVLGWGFSVDTGNVIGFSAMQPLSNAMNGLVVSFDNGTSACSFYYGKATPRRTNITMVCDLAAGIGAPAPMYNNTVEYPSRSCVYNFVWRSAHACPLCTLADYDFELQPCVNGLKLYTYRKLFNCYGEPTADQIPSPIVCYDCPSSTNGGVCNTHGTCDEYTGQCNCQSQWSGQSCSDCATGYFGVNCQNACPGGAKSPCNSHGSCGSGVKGSGLCACTTGWAGSACDVCDSGFTGTTCEALPASVTDVVPAWAVILIVVVVITLIVAAVFLYRAKKQVEYRYSRLLSSQPIELGDDDNNQGNMETLGGLPDDDDREQQQQ